MHEKPYVVIGSPPCTDFCTLNQNINHKRMTPDEVRRRMTEARIHLEFCAEVYVEQMRAGRHFLHHQQANSRKTVQEMPTQP